MRLVLGISSNPFLPSIHLIKSMCMLHDHLCGCHPSYPTCLILMASTHSFHALHCISSLHYMSRRHHRSRSCALSFLPVVTCHFQTYTLFRQTMHTSCHCYHTNASLVFQCSFLLSPLLHPIQVLSGKEKHYGCLALLSFLLSGVDKGASGTMAPSNKRTFVL